MAIADDAAATAAIEEGEDVKEGGLGEGGRGVGVVVVEGFELGNDSREGFVLLFLHERELRRKESTFPDLIFRFWEFPPVRL